MDNKQALLEVSVELGTAMLRYLKAELRVEEGDAERDQLQADLIAYGDHQHDCSIYNEQDYHAAFHCSCGWYEVEQERHYAAAPEPEDQGEY